MTKLANHEDMGEVERHLDLSKSLRPSDYAVLFWLARIGSRDLRVFDFGGNIGNLFYSYSPYLKESRPLVWRVYDLPVILHEGRRIAAERGATQLRFSQSIADASTCNVLLVSGALHYWEKSVQAFIEQFAPRPEHVFINRSPIRDAGAAFITVQQTAKCAFPCIVRNAGEIISSFESAGYELVDR